MNQELKYFIKDKFIEDNSIKISYESIYDEKSNDLIKEDNGYYIILLLGDSNFYFFKNIIKVKLKITIDKFVRYENFSFCSSYDLFKYFNEHNYNPYILINEEKKFMNDIFKLYDTLIKKEDKEINFYYELLGYNDFQLTNLLTINLFKDCEIEPDNLSKYFYKYFKIEKQNKITYYSSEERKRFILNILRIKASNNLYKFKVCGISAIGKSFTLFLISKKYHSIVYINLKVLNDLEKKKEFNQVFNMILESCETIHLSDNEYNNLKKLFSDIKGRRCWQILLNLINYLLLNNINCMIILDQFKASVIEKNIFDEIENNLKKQNVKNISIIICSSTNDKDIRKECIKSWKNGIIQEIPEKNTEELFHYIDILNIKNEISEKNNEEYNEILKRFNFLPKYQNIFQFLNEKYNNKIQVYKEKMNIIKKKIKENLFNLYTLLLPKKFTSTEENINKFMIDYLNELKKNVNKKLSYDKLSNIIKIISLKYFIFKFQNNYFSYQYSFDYIEDIIIEIIGSYDSFSFFQKMDYKKYNGSTIGQLFEKTVFDYLTNQKLKLPGIENLYNDILEVEEIVKMDKFFLDLNKDYFIKNLVTLKVDMKNEKSKITSKHKKSLENYLNLKDDTPEFYKNK